MDIILQQQITDWLSDTLDFIKIQPQCILHWGPNYFPERIPAAYFDLIFAQGAMPDFTQLATHLKPQGILLFASTAAQITLHMLGDALWHSGLQDPVTTQDQGIVYGIAWGTAYARHRKHPALSQTARIPLIIRE
jgi:hypothetical protein